MLGCGVAAAGSRCVVCPRPGGGLVRRRRWSAPRPGSYADGAEQGLARAAAASVRDSWNDGAARLGLRIGARAHRAAPDSTGDVVGAVRGGAQRPGPGAGRVPGRDTGAAASREGAVDGRIEP